MQGAIEGIVREKSAVDDREVDGNDGIENAMLRSQVRCCGGTPVESCV